MYLLDTNVISELRPGKREASAQVRAWAAGVALEHQYLSVITLHELEAGVLAMERRDLKQGAMLRAWLNGVRELFIRRTLPVDEAVAIRCAWLQVPDRMPDMDALIAATALVHGMRLVTRNVGDFDRTGVQLLNPWLPQPSAP